MLDHSGIILLSLNLNSTLTSLHTSAKHTVSDTVAQKCQMVSINNKQNETGQMLSVLN